MKILNYPQNVLIPKLDTYLESLNKEVSRSLGKKAIHPSSISGCARAIVYEMLGVSEPEKTSPGTRRIFDNGHGVHHRIESYLEKAGLFDILPDGKPAREVRLKNEEYWIEGTADGILNIDGIKFVLEIKSINTWGFSTLDAPNWYYLDQIHLYFLCLGIPQGIFLYENKDTQVLREFVVEQDDERMGKILDKIRFIQQCVEKGNLPEMTCTCRDKGKYCKFLNQCFPKQTK